jgi:hypothetical protein
MEKLAGSSLGLRISWIEVLFKAIRVNFPIYLNPPNRWKELVQTSLFKAFLKASRQKFFVHFLPSNGSFIVWLIVE